MAGEIIGAIGEGVSGIAGSIASVVNTNKTIKANKAMAEYQYNKDLEMWNRQNSYNSPASQMQRFKEAGLNPNLMYGQGNAGNATVLPKYQAPKIDYNYQPPQLGNVIGAYQDVKIKNAQYDQLRSQTENTDARTNTETLKAILYSINSQIKANERDNWMTKFKADIAKTTGQTELMKSQAGVADAKTKETMFLMNMRAGLIQSQIGNLLAQEAYTRARQSKIPYEIAMLKAQRGKIPYETMNLISQAEYRNALIPQIAANIARTKASTGMIGTQQKWLPWQSLSSGTMKALDMMLQFVPAYKRVSSPAGSTWTKTSKGKW